jgi:hypothetical protein
MHRDIDAAMIEALIGLARQTYQLAHRPASNNSRERRRPAAGILLTALGL